MSTVDLESVVEQQGQSFLEEVANSVTHGIGALLSIAGLTLLTVLAALRGDAWHVVGCSVFGVTLVLLYLASTLYHSIPYPRARAFFRACDHGAIYLLIAGSYTPFVLVNLRGPWGWSLFGIVWGLALLGVTAQVFNLRDVEKLRVAVYITMGWVAVIAFRPLIATMPFNALVLIVLGGLAYTSRCLFSFSGEAYPSTTQSGISSFWPEVRSTFWQCFGLCCLSR